MRNNAYLCFIDYAKPFNKVHDLFVQHGKFNLLGKDIKIVQKLEKNPPVYR